MAAAEDEHDDDPPDGFSFPLHFTWMLPPLPEPPDHLVLPTAVARIAGVSLPLPVAAIDTIPSVTDAPERSLSIVARVNVSLAQVYLGEDVLCDTLDKCRRVSLYLLEQAEAWLGDSEL
jgi:hypothetical protein